MRVALLAIALLATIVAACGAGGGSPTLGEAPVATAAQAAAAVRAANPLFDGLEARNPELIGQGSWWEAEPGDSGDPPGSWTVTFVIGWGDCQAGCIDTRRWTYDVTKDGSHEHVSEVGSTLTEEVIAERLAASEGSGAIGRVLAGPACPLARPGDPACADRPVAGARLRFDQADGAEGGFLTTDASGWYRMTLEPGDYVLTAEPVTGLMGTPAPIPFTVRAGEQTLLDVPYDTGIR